MSAQILIGDCRLRMKELPDNSVDSVVCDPPYELGFMGKSWDSTGIANDNSMWAEVLRALKPGGHLVAFSGTRTYHRMVCAIEDAGFEIRDQLAWIYGSGFPKSHDVSKGIDKLAGERRGRNPDIRNGPNTRQETKGQPRIVGGYSSDTPLDDGPITEAAQQWQGWGTALKPSLEPVCFARKPFTNEQEWVTIRALIEGLWAALWRVLPANDAAKDSTLNPHACGVDLRASAQWSVERLSNTRAALSEAMDMSRFELALTSSLSTASSWNATLAGLCLAESTSTIETASSTTTDLRTLRFCLSKITPESIILAHKSGAWSSADACNAARYLNATLATLDATRELSALAPAIEQDHRDSLDAGATPNLTPICLARKPLDGTVANNVLTHGTGALNIDGCRIEGSDVITTHSRGKAEAFAKRPGEKTVAESGRTVPQNRAEFVGNERTGRWPANLCHDGSDEVLAGFPETSSGSREGGVYHDSNQRGHSFKPARTGTLKALEGDSGSAARFFYCAKTTTEERGKGNIHPTVKPIALMRWLCRLVTPPGGTILDPFMGSGSTLIAADAEQFNAIGCELSPEYAAIAEQRIRNAAGMFADVKVAA